MNPADKVFPPKYRERSFTCPHCGVVAQQHWSKSARFEFVPRKPARAVGFDVCASVCEVCRKACLWADEKMILPDVEVVAPPNEDLPEEIQADYKEAASVLQKSPRAAAALLRLALQKLCRELGGAGKNIQQDIDLLVEKGMPQGVLKAMDSVRIIGNEALHPGQIDMRDDTGTAAMLFRLINFVAEKTLTASKQVDAIYAGLPDSKKRKVRGGESGAGD